MTAATTSGGNGTGGAGRGGNGSAPGISARILTKDGWAVQHAVLTVTDAAGAQVSRTPADPDGTVRTAPLPPGAYTVIVTAVGYAPAAATAVVPASGTARVGTVVLSRLGGTQLPPPGTWTIDPAHSSVGAVAQHLGISSVHGRFPRFAGRIEIGGTPEESSVSAAVEAASIDTGNAVRDAHLRSADFLDVERNPQILYRSSSVVPAGPDRWTVHGELTLNGVVRPVALDLAYLGTGPDPWGGVRAAFRATTELHRSDFAMNFNQVVQAGIAAIGTTVKVELDVQAVQGDALPQQ
ncbi:hypothetical protein GQS52_13230 [Streptomyces sp. SCUT-3]|nr:hypothetical protein C0036_20595 [Streptomyces sp. DJ]QMV22589.1 hypothetical protein GQS52_13230 [Streptomyces sp. SCUT-3]